MKNKGEILSLSLSLSVSLALSLNLSHSLPVCLSLTDIKTPFFTDDVAFTSSKGYGTLAGTPLCVPGRSLKALSSGH